MVTERPHHHNFSLHNGPHLPKINGDRDGHLNGDVVAPVVVVSIVDRDEAASVVFVVAFVVIFAAAEDRHAFKTKTAVVSNAAEVDTNIQICVQRLIRIAAGVAAKAISYVFAVHQEPQWLQIDGLYLVQ